MKLYDCDTAPSPRRVRVFLAEKGLEIPVVQVDLRNGEHLGERFIAINPRCSVPVLELDDGAFLSEAMAICRYLEALQPEPSLFGRDPAEQGRVAMWNAIAELDGLFAVAESLRNRARGFRGRALPGQESYEQIPELVERGRRRASACFALLDERLADNHYLAGHNFSVADITAMVAIDFAGWIKLPVTEGHAHLKRWYDRVSQRPSASA